jgi:hypothetical protein
LRREFFAYTEAKSTHTIPPTLYEYWSAADAGALCPRWAAPDARQVLEGAAA